MSTTPLEGLGGAPGERSSEFHSAVEAGDLERVKELLDQTESVNLADEEGKTLLHDAVLLERVELVRLLLTRGATIDKSDKHGETPLHVAARSGNLHVLNLLLDQGASVHKADGSGRNALHNAASYGHKEGARLLLNRGAKLNAADNYGWTPLHHAVFGGHTGVVEFLLHQGADVDKRNKSGKTPLHYAVSGCDLEATKLLLDKGADSDAADECGMSPFHYAAGCAPVAVLLLDQSEEVHKSDHSSQNASINENFGGPFVVEQGSLNGNAVGDESNTSGKTLLHYAASNGYLEAVKYLLNNGADMDVTDAHGMSALHYAARNGHTGIVRTFLEHEAAADRSDFLGRTPFCDALDGGHFDVAKLLLSEGETPLEKYLLQDRNSNIPMQGRRPDRVAGSGDLSILSHRNQFQGTGQKGSRTTSKSPPNARSGSRTAQKSSRTVRETQKSRRNADIFTKKVQAQLANKGFLRMLVLSLQHSLMEIKAEADIQDFYTVHIEGDPLPVEWPFEYKRVDQATYWLEQLRSAGRFPTKLVFDGTSVDIAKILEESKKATGHGGPIYEYESRILLYRVLVDLLGCSPYLGDCSAALYANGLAGRPASHIEIAYQLERLLRRGIKKSGPDKILLNLAKISQSIVSLRENLKDIQSFEISKGQNERQHRMVRDLHHLMLELIMHVKSTLWPTVVKSLYASVRNSQIFFGMTKELQNVGRMTSLYIGMKFFPEQKVLRIFFNKRKRISGFAASREGSNILKHEYYTFDEAVRWIDVGKGVQFSEVAAALTKCGITPSDVIDDLAPYLCKQQCGCWIQCLRNEKETGGGTQIIMVNEPEFFAIPYRELAHVKEAGSMEHEGKQITIYHPRQGAKLKDAKWAGEGAVPPENVVVLLGLDILDRKNLQWRYASGKKKHMKEIYKEIDPLQDKKASEDEILPWWEWFTGFKLMEINNSWWLIRREEWGRALRSRIQELGIALKPPLVSLEGRITLGQKPYSQELYNSLADNGIGEPWISVEQLFYERIQVPDRWKDKEGRTAHYHRMWQWLNLVAILKKVKYTGRSVSALFSSDNSATYSVTNNTPFVMHEMGKMDARDFQLVRNGDNLIQSGFVELDAKLDLKFESWYDCASDGSCGDEEAVRLTDVADSELLKKKTARKVVLEPAFAQKKPERVLVCGTWA